MIVAIDGPAGVGKSTISRLIADKAGYFYLNSGNFYRAITLAVLQKGIDPGNESEVIKIAEKSLLQIKERRLYLNDELVEDKLHSDEIDKWVAQLSSFIPVREIVNKNLRKTGKDNDLIVEGRDIATVVFPDADVKVYLDASIEKRAQRRFEQGVSSLSIEEQILKIRSRDQIDKNKPFGNLKIDPDALYLDTSDLTIDQVCEKVLQKIYEVMKLE